MLKTMLKVWRVFAHEYMRHVLRKRFIFSVLSIPIVVLVIVVIFVIVLAMEFNTKPIGYVDQSGWLANPVMPNQKEAMPFLKRVQITSFADQTSARSAMDKGEIQGYYLIGQDYLQTGIVDLVAPEPVGANASGDFETFLRANLLRGLPEPIFQRIYEGSEVIVRSASGSRQLSESQWINIALPIIVGVLFIIVINTSGGYLLQAIVEEKENRVIEIVTTSISPGQFMTGKIIGNLCVGLTQMAIWLLFPILAFFILRGFIPALRQVEISSQFIWLSLATLLFSFAFIAALMAAVGATMAEVQEAQQIGGLFSLPVTIPFVLIMQLLMNPGGAVAVTLSLIPFTAPVALPLRAAFTDIPGWQVSLALGILFFSAVGAIWLAGRAFRIGMLRYGKKVSLRELFKRA
jgi:ABC-2 type transport system permease protein